MHTKRQNWIGTLAPTKTEDETGADEDTRVKTKLAPTKTPGSPPLPDLGLMNASSHGVLHLFLFFKLSCMVALGLLYNGIMSSATYVLQHMWHPYLLRFALSCRITGSACSIGMGKHIILRPSCFGLSESWFT